MQNFQGSTPKDAMMANLKQGLRNLEQLYLEVLKAAEKALNFFYFCLSLGHFHRQV